MVSCAVVGLGESHRGQVLETRKRQRLRLSGVGRVSEPALMRNDSWCAGKPRRIQFLVCDSGSMETLSINFDWTCRVLNVLSQ